ncbi:MAG: hypothetical protein LBV61_01700 [Burkholderiaceae bacterium]|jgi:outer membrane lipoprotein SlyB|nr:hypothetical protein [Burkholderiaceae bacterium]
MSFIPTRLVCPAAVAACTLTLAVLAGCAVPAYQSTAVYPYQPAQSAAPGYGYAGPSGAAAVEQGHIVNIDMVRTTTAPMGTSGVGALAGAVIGGVLGYQFGNGMGKAATTAVGYMGGSLLGNAIEANSNPPRVNDTYRIAIQTDSGAYRVFNVPSPGDLRVGDRVQISNGQLSKL